MNRLDALKYFVVAADTLNFRQTAAHFAVSPQVITRVIGELENEVGEVLFKRNTRQIRLTDFGLNFLPRAERLLREEQQLFGIGKLDDSGLSGLVRITLPPSVDSDRVFGELLTALAPYPDIAIDWRTSFDVMKAVDDNIDIGVRICQVPQEDWVAKKLYDVNESIVASPKLIRRLGMPKDIDDLVEHFPVGTLLNTKIGRGWHWNVDNKNIPLLHSHVIAIEPRNLLQAVLAGRAFAPFSHAECAPYFDSGELVEVFPSNISKWAYYLYRPYQTITPKRVLLVFELLEKILKRDSNER